MNNNKEQKIYTGNFLITSDTFILAGFFIFSCYMVFKCIELENNKYWVGFFIWIILFAGFTYKMNYFILTENKLIAKNPIWTWKKIEFDLKTIKNITIMQPMRSPISLKINTKNSSKLIGATSLRNKTWKKLKQDLEEKNVTVIDKIVWD
jgi:hypothetical protein